MKLRLTVMASPQATPCPTRRWTSGRPTHSAPTPTPALGLYRRGLQPTNADGVATVRSIYPGWYPPRTNHVHVKVPVGGPTSAKYDGGHASHTGNLFFPEAVSTIVAKISPYTDNTASRTTLTNDFVSSGQNGSGSVLTLVPVDASKPESGSAASIVLGVDPSRTPSPIGISGIVT